MDQLSFEDPIFRTYAIAACVMILKTIAMAWATVWQMSRLRTGYRSPEDLRKTMLNPEPHPGQLDKDERVERFRRIHQNDLENVPFFLVAGLLFALTAPPLWLAQVMLYGYVLSRLLHFWAYASARTHDTRATFWTIGQILLFVMLGFVLAAALA